MIAALTDHGVDLVCLAGYMRIITPAFVEAFPNRILNVHPSLLPAFPGLDAQHQAFDYGAKVAGCTVHFVDEAVDHGVIVLQKTVPVLDDDTVELRDGSNPRAGTPCVSRGHRESPQRRSIASWAGGTCSGRLGALCAALLCWCTASPRVDLDVHPFATAEDADVTISPARWEFIAAAEVLRAGDLLAVHRDDEIAAEHDRNVALVSLLVASVETGLVRCSAGKDALDQNAVISGKADLLGDIGTDGQCDDVELWDGGCSRTSCSRRGRRGRC